MQGCARLSYSAHLNLNINLNLNPLPESPRVQV